MTSFNSDSALTCFCARRARGGLTVRYPLILMLLLFVIGVSQALAQANAVYVTRWIDESFGSPRYDGLWVYRWPDLSLQTVDRSVPEHSSLVMSPDGRELYLLSLSRVYVLDRETRHVLRSFPVDTYAQAFNDSLESLGGFFSPLRPDLLILSTCVWIDVRAGLVLRSPATLTPGYACSRAHLDDSGRYVILRMARFPPGQPAEFALRIVNLDGEDILGRIIPGFNVGTVLVDGRIVVGHARDGDSDLQVLDPSTLMPLARLPIAANSDIWDLHGDGQGGFAALIKPSNSPRTRLLRWRTVPGQPEVVREHAPDLEGLPSLRAQRGYLEYHSRVRSFGDFSAGGRLLLGGRRVELFDIDRGVSRELPMGPTQVITDIALAPGLQALTRASAVPVLSIWGLATFACALVVVVRLVGLKSTSRVAGEYSHRRRERLAAE